MLIFVIIILLTQNWLHRIQSIMNFKWNCYVFFKCFSFVQSNVIFISKKVRKRYRQILRGNMFFNVENAYKIRFTADSFLLFYTFHPILEFHLHILTLPLRKATPVTTCESISTQKRLLQSSYRKLIVKRFIFHNFYLYLQNYLQLLFFR